MKKTIALASACITSLMFGLEISSVPVILPTLGHVLGGSFEQLQWIANAYTIACTTVLMATGKLADRFGRKRLYMISIVLFGLTSLGCGLAHSVGVLIAGRFLQGLGGGAMLICQMAVLSLQFQEGKERARAFGIWGIVFGAGLGFGPIVGGVIVALASWQWVFLVHFPIAVGALVLVWIGVDESRDPSAKRLDLAGMILLALSVFGLTYFITSQASFYILIASGVSFLAFLWVERVSPEPMFDFSVFRIRPFSGALLGSVGMNCSFWPFMIYLPIYFQNHLGYSTVKTSLSLLAYTLPTLAVPPLAERLSLRYKPGIVIPFGLFTIGLGFILMKTAAMLPGELIAGIGLGLTNTPVTNTTIGSVPESRAGMASGIDMSARLITLAINIAVMGFILERMGAGAAMLYGGIGAWIMAVLSLAIFRKQ